MSGEELAGLISGLGIAIAKDKTVEQLTLLSVIFTQLGDMMNTIAVQKEHINNLK